MPRRRELSEAVDLVGTGVVEMGPMSGPGVGRTGAQLVPRS